ncbi:MAG: ATP synthase F0 subunit B [Blastocatellia bacterium]|nr:ATP synthase F0 subunit B [Blastocatellia bacterium]
MQIYPHFLPAESFWTSPLGFPKLINLLIFLGILYYLLRRPLGDFFARRLASVRQTLERAAKEKAAATEKMTELDARLNRLGAEVAEIREQSKREAFAERERLKAETEKDIERIRIVTSREIDAAKQVALADLREFAATKSVELAEQIIRRELTPEDDARMLRRVSEELSNAK